MVISIINQKGGTGKTTTSLNLSVALAEKGKRVLVIDLDPQGSLTYSFGIHQPDNTIADLIAGTVALPELVIPKEEVDVVPANIRLADLEISLVNEEGRESFIKNTLTDITGYDYIIMDCPPSLSLLTVNALNVSTGVIIPLQLEVLGVHALDLILATIKQVQDQWNNKLQILGVLPVMVDYRKNLTQEIKDYVKKHYDLPIFKTGISINVKASESPSFGCSVLSYSKNSKSAKDYRNFGEELISLTN